MLRRHPSALAAATIGLSAALAGCSATAPPTDDRSAGDTSAVRTLGHVHGLATNPADGALLVATHDGLFTLTAQGKLDRLSPVIDLMGFAVAGPDHYLASGHPGPDVDLPQPVGLIESTDGGRTWTPLSRQGQSDFHALAVSQAGVIGYDGSLVSTTDRQVWDESPIPAAPASLAASDHGQQLLATTDEGLLRSADAGRSWSPVPDAPFLQVVDWAAGLTTAGISPSGEVWTSEDGGLTWRAGARLGAAPQALEAVIGDDSLHIVAVVGDSVVKSTDGGRTFQDVSIMR